MMVVGLGAAAYCSMGKSLRWKGSQHRSARSEKGDDRYLLVRKLRPKRRTFFYGKFHLCFFYWVFSDEICISVSNSAGVFFDTSLSIENCEIQKSLMPYPCSHFYVDIKFGERLYSNKKRRAWPFFF